MHRRGAQAAGAAGLSSSPSTPQPIFDFMDAMSALHPGQHPPASCSVLCTEGSQSAEAVGSGDAVERDMAPSCWALRAVLSGPHCDEEHHAE